MSDKIMLLDGHSLLNRAFYGLPDLTNAEGKHTNAVLGFLNIMLRYVEEEKPTHLLVAFDRKEPTFRHIKYKEYKGTRKPMPAELHEQVPLMKEVLKMMEIPIITQAGIEADDILGTIGKEAEEAEESRSRIELTNTEDKADEEKPEKAVITKKSKTV